MAIALSYRSEVEELLEGFGLSEQELAAALGATARSVRRWASGDAVPRPAARERIEDLLDVMRRLRSSVRAESIPKWVRRRVELLDGRRPIESIVRGDLERLLRVADALGSGAFV